MKRIQAWREKWRKADRVQRGGIGLVVGAAMLVMVVAVIKHLAVARDRHEREREIALGPKVQVATVIASPPERQLVLLGEARPYVSATLYAKVVGYVKEVRADKGDTVEEGQLLATIEAPETNQDYDAAAADARNKQLIADRIKPLLEKKLVSQQEADQAFSDAAQANARLGSIGAIKGYQEIRAPFNGMVTARFADPGALLQSSGQPIFTVSRINRLRVYAYVDQRDAAFVRNGLPVQIYLPERPEITVPGKITRFSGELDTNTRKLLVEIDVDNKAGQLVAGSFVQVSLKVPAPSYLQVPVEALIIRQAKTVVAIVTSSSTLTFRDVAIADNDGQQVKVLTGLQAGERVAMNLGNSLDEGSKVQPLEIPGSSSGTLPSPAAGSETKEAGHMTSSGTIHSAESSSGTTTSK